MLGDFLERKSAVTGTMDTVFGHLLELAEINGPAAQESATIVALPAPQKNTDPNANPTVVSGEDAPFAQMTLQKERVTASGVFCPAGFRVLAGAIFARRTPRGAESHVHVAGHKALVAASSPVEGSEDLFVLNEDMEFKSIGMATSALYGAITSAARWKYEDGSPYVSENADTSGWADVRAYFAKRHPNAETGQRPLPRKSLVDGRIIYLLRHVQRDGLRNGFKLNKSEITALSDRVHDVRFLTWHGVDLVEIPMSQLIEKAGAFRESCDVKLVPTGSIPSTYVLKIGNTTTDLVIEGTPL